VGIVVFEEQAICSVVQAFEELLPGYLRDLTNQSIDKLELPMLTIDDEYVDPESMKVYPGACIWVDDSREEIKHRIVSFSTVTLTIMTAVTGYHGDKRSYRYHAAIREVLKEKQCEIGLVDISGRVFYRPVAKDANFLKIAETQVSIQVNE